MPPSDFCSVSSLDLEHQAPHRRSQMHRLWHLLRDWLERGFDWYGCRHQALRHRRDLARLDDAMLKDIGLSRADVESEIGKPFWRC